MSAHDRQEAVIAQRWGFHWAAVARIAKTHNARVDAQRLAAGHYARARVLMGIGPAARSAA